MLYRSLRALPLLLASLAPAACVVDLGDLDHLGVCGGHRDDLRSEQFTFDEPVTAVIVDGGTADVRVRAHEGAGAVVDASWSDDHRPQMRVDDGVLHVSPTCGSGCCYAELSLAIPTAATLEVDLGTGDVAVADLSGAVDLDVGTGDLSLDRLAGALGLHTGTGSIEGHGLLAADAWVDVGTGDVSLTWDGAASLAAVTIDVGTGSVDLRVPEGAYDLRLSAGVGDVSVAELQDREDASGRIDVDVGTGDVDVRGF